MSIVHESIQDGIGQRVITDGLIPLIGGQLTDHQRRGTTMTIIHNFHQIISLGRLEGFQELLSNLVFKRLNQAAT